MPIDLNDPTSVALFAAEALSGAGIEHALYGGLLLAAYGDARETKDADLAVVGRQTDAARAALDALGISAHVAFDDVEFGGLSVARITLLGGDALNTVDLVRPRSDRYARAVLARSVESDLRERRIRVVSPEDYVLLKALSTRERDLDDAASVFRRSGDVLDMMLIESEADLLGTETPGWDVGGRLSESRRRATEVNR